MEDEEPVFNTAKERDAYYRFFKVAKTVKVPEKKPAKKKPALDPEPTKIKNYAVKYISKKSLDEQYHYKNDYSKPQKREQVRVKNGAVVKMALGKGRGR